MTETLKCTVPSANAVKDAAISCVTKATNLPDIWMAIAGVVTALATIVLAIFAYRAWTSSRKQISIMQHELEKADERATQAIVAASNIESQREMNSALFAYMSAHASVFRAASSTSADLADAVAELHTSDFRFIMVHELPGSGGPVRNFDQFLTLAASEFMTERGKNAESLATKALDKARSSGFYFINDALRDLHRGSLSTETFLSAMTTRLAEMLNKYGEHLPTDYMKKVKERGWDRVDPVN